MTLDETITILKVIKAEWPHSFKGITRQDADAKLNLWAEMFKDDDPALVGAAVKALIVGGGLEFAPTIGAIKAKMRDLVNPDEMTEVEAWARVKKAVCRSAYNSKEDFERLPETLKRLVGSPSQLRDWSMMDIDTLESVIGSNFQRSYKIKAKREREYAAIPADVKKAVAGVVEHLKIGDGQNDGERSKGTKSLPGHWADTGSGGIHEEQDCPD